MIGRGVIAHSSVPTNNQRNMTQYIGLYYPTMVARYAIGRTTYNYDNAEVNVKPPPPRENTREDFETWVSKTHKFLTPAGHISMPVATSHVTPPLPTITALCGNSENLPFCVFQTNKARLPGVNRAHLLHGSPHGISHPFPRWGGLSDSCIIVCCLLSLYIIERQERTR